MRALPRVDNMRVIDMHVHIGPEFLRRKYSAASLAEEARREDFGVVMKNHFQPTTGQVSQIRRPDDEVPLVGSVALNFNCGGLDDHGRPRRTFRVEARRDRRRPRSRPLRRLDADDVLRSPSALLRSS